MMCEACLDLCCTVCGHEACEACEDCCDHPDCLVPSSSQGHLKKTHACVFPPCPSGCVRKTRGVPVVVTFTEALTISLTSYAVVGVVNFAAWLESMPLEHMAVWLQFTPWSRRHFALLSVVGWLPLHLLAKLAPERFERIVVWVLADGGASRE